MNENFPQYDDSEGYECAICEGYTDEVFSKNGALICEDCLCGEIRGDDGEMDGQQMRTGKRYNRNFYAWVHHKKWDKPWQPNYSIKRKHD